MDSDAHQDWEQVEVKETGGFAGLRRGASVSRSVVGETKATRVAELITRLGRHNVVAASSMPDRQKLEVTVASGGHTASWTFDTSDLPDEVTDLLAELPDLRPLPPLIR